MNVIVIVPRALEHFIVFVGNGLEAYGSHKAAVINLIFGECVVMRDASRIL